MVCGSMPGIRVRFASLSLIHGVVAGSPKSLRGYGGRGVLLDDHGYKRGCVVGALTVVPSTCTYMFQNK